MPWYFPWSDSIKKRACRYLLQHYLGNFLQEKLTLDQLSVDLYNGTGTISEVLLDVAAINDALESTNVPVEIVDGFVGTITASIPWSALVSDNTKMEVKNLEITIQPKQRDQNAGVMFDSMFSSFSGLTTSMQLAQECLKTDTADKQPDSAKPYEGLEMFAQTIEAVLSKVKVTFVDTIVRLEHLPKGARTGAAVEVRVDRIEYYDDQAMDQGTSVDLPPAGTQTDRPHFEVAAISHKNLRLMGVTIYCDEFSASSRTCSRETDVGATGRSTQEAAYSVSPEFSLKLEPSVMLRSTGGESVRDSDPIKIAAFMGRQEVKVKIKQTDEVAGPKLEIESTFGGVNIHLSPRQMHLLLEIAQGLSTPDLCDNTNVRKRLAVSKPMEADDFTKVEEDLQKQMQSGRGTNRQTQHFFRPDFEDAMTTHSLDDDEDDTFLSIGSARTDPISMEGSYSSSTGPSSTVTASSFNPVVSFRKNTKKEPSSISAYNRTAKPKSPKSKGSLGDDPAADLTRYKLRISFMSVMLLHEDPPATPSDALDQGQSSAEKLQKMSESYFGRVQGITTSGMGTDLAGIRDQYSRACPHDHIGILCKPVNLEGNQKSSGVAYTLSLDVTIGLAEAVEALYDRTSPTHAFLSLQRDQDDFVPEYCELLVFDQDGEDKKTSAMYSSTQTTTPCVKIHVQSLDKKYQSSRLHSSPNNKTDIHIELAKCRSEVDMTLIDRINELLHPQPLTKTKPTATIDPSVYVSAAQVMFCEAIEEGPSQSDRKTELKITTNHATLLLRFPIPDLRSKQEHDQQWWKRNLQKELLILELQQLEFQTTFWAQTSFQKYEFTCRDGHGLFQESADLDPMSFIRISTADNPLNDKEEGFDWPRFVIKVFPEVHSVLSQPGLDELDDPTLGHDSLNGACSDLHKPEASPFTRSRVMYDNEELTIPGDRQEMVDFEEKAVNNTKLVLELNIPNINACLTDQHFFELIYNRVLNDLVLWEPLAPTPLEVDKSIYPPHYSSDPWTLNYGQQLLQQENMESFRMCKSGAQYDSSSDSETSSGNYPSFETHRQKQKKKQLDRQHRQSKMCFKLDIGKGKVNAFAPLKTSEGGDSETECGEFLIEVEEATVFVDVHHNADPDLQYVCVHANKAALYHKGCVDIPTDRPVIERPSPSPPSHLYPTIYLSDPTVYTHLAGQVGQGADRDGHDMVSVAVKIRLDAKQNNKFITVGLGVRGGTLQHRMTRSGQHWITQVMNLFDVKEFPILGYVPPKVLTELHVHMWSCAIDYRPLFLPYCAVLTLESFSISSNVLADSPMSLLRFLFQDAALYISDKKNHKVVDLKKSYVCVADVGMFELSLRTSDGKDKKYPKVDLRISNNILHLRTCSDSFKALADLINYFASDGDLQEHDDTEQTSVMKPASSEASLSSIAPEIRQSHLEQVHDLMAEAMRESESSHDSKESSPEIYDDHEHKEVFFYTKPSAAESGAVSFRNVADSNSDSDEESSITLHLKTQPQHRKHRHQSPVQHKTSAVPTTEPLVDSGDMIASGDMSVSGLSDDSVETTEARPEKKCSDEDFCIIDDPGLGIAPRDGEPVIKPLTKDPIQLLDNHFSVPLGKTDVLRSPEHFPQAVYRYTLSEMSLVWYMYGGRDFESSPPSRTTNKSAKAFQHQRFGRVGKIGWQARGGIGRDIDVLMELQLSKVRLQHELFPEDTEQASRQIALINDIEIRDRLASSKINKFLYQYSSDSMPRQSHTSMFLIKALHVRPEANLPTQECSLKVSIQPLRFNIDQDALHFLMMFFTEVCDDSSEDVGSAAGSTEIDHPVMQLGAEVVDKTEEEKITPEELHIKFDEMKENEEAAEQQQETVEAEESQDSSRDKPVFIKEENMGEDTEQQQQQKLESENSTRPNRNKLIFIKCFQFSPDVPIRLDYHGKRADMGQGTVANFVVGLAQLNCSELQLKRLYYRKGLLGMDKLGRYCRDEWLQDIMKNQLPSILGGVGPMHSLVQFVQGVKNLFWMPVEQYQKDGRIVRGLQKGTQSFMTCTAMSTLELTNRVVQTIQYVAEVSFDMVSPLPTLRRRKPPRYRLKHPSDMREGVVNAYTVITELIGEVALEILCSEPSNRQRRPKSQSLGTFKDVFRHPSDMREGFNNAYQIVTEGFKGTAENIVREAVEGHETKGLTGAVGGVLRQVPPSVIKPIILTTEATSNILGGMRNQLLPDKKKEDEEKWKPEDSANNA